MTEKEFLRNISKITCHGCLNQQPIEIMGSQALHREGNKLVPCTSKQSQVYAVVVECLNDLAQRCGDLVPDAKSKLAREIRAVPMFESEWPKPKAEAAS